VADKLSSNYKSNPTALRCTYASTNTSQTQWWNVCWGLVQHSV